MRRGSVSTPKRHDQSATLDDTLQADLDQAIEARDRLLVGWRSNRHLDHWKAAGQLAVLDRWIVFLSQRVEPLTERDQARAIPLGNDSQASGHMACRESDRVPAPRSVSGSAPLLLGIAPNPFEETT